LKKVYSHSTNDQWAPLKAAVLHELGRPSFSEFPDPSPGVDAVVARVLAAGLNHVDLAKAAGRFYTGPPPLPSVAGSDGVARLADGSRVYFDSSVPPYGALAELTLVKPRNTYRIVEDGVDDADAAALGNAGIAAALAVGRARLRAGERVAVLGATGAVGSVAVQLCHAYGAATVVAVGRDAGRLADLQRRHGATPVSSDSGREDLAAAIEVAAGGPVDVIVDPVWGEPALAAMGAAGQRARLVQLGQRAAGSIEFPAALLRSKRMELIGVSSALEPPEERSAAYAEILSLAALGKVEMLIERVPLHQIEEAWARQADGPGRKLVAIP
jgi:NADPH:quinone reductase-like Zn-dependent oxidoreductase